MTLGFKSRIYLSVSLLVALSLIILGSINIYNLQDKMVSSLVKETEIKLKSQVSNMETWYQGKQQAIDNGAASFSLNLSDAENLKLVDLLEKSGNFSTVAIAYSNGTSFISRDHQILGNNILQNRPWYKTAIQSNDLIVTDIYQDLQTGEKTISLTKAVTENGRKVGVLIGDIVIDNVASSINQMRFAGGAATLVDRNSVFFASDDPSDIGKTPTQVNPVFADMERGFETKEQGHLTFPYLGKDFTGYFQRIHLTGDNHWTLMVFIDKSTAQAGVESAKWNAIWTGLVLLLVSCACMVLSIESAYKPLLRLKAAVLALSQGSGDLTSRLQVDGNDDLAQISQGFNSFTEQLQQMMLHIAQASQNISSSITQLGQSARDNETQLISHSAETEQVVTAITEMSESAHSVAVNVTESNKLTASANTGARESLAIVNNAVSNVESLVGEVETMSGRIAAMNNDTMKIYDVVNVIEEISAQTNLLALNAAIEAARAGEQGRGFAVVADEVRALAVRTQNSTSEISSMLQQLLDVTSSVVNSMKQTQQQCQSTADSTAQVSTSLTEMSQSVNEIDDVSTQIATATEEQSRVTEELSRNMLTIRDIVESLVVSGRQTVSATELLAQANSELDQLVRKFKLY
ncbi:methyl-accepting chemotaxis protein [Vibrio porteresiae]|uniref:Methyl-accepting chemotaxis protein n=1 Tax=Vibrio porteresiae DSM 19223 TaxID=1123496 RepID=A0ABZ0Q9J5_9VIBR|nr:methyl-accepting chemotaxis protein [Vibrio porteresiae]WPC73075.1 methyl-accepting chemotaxis protein [Vibrio porteresiae DSM 19223]